jgi:hypothetical protein
LRGRSSGYFPTPMSMILWGLIGAESSICKVAILSPPIAGLKVTWIAQLAPGSRLCGQVLVWLKSIPEVKTSAIVIVELPVFVTETVFGGVCDPTICEPKSKLSGSNFTIVRAVVEESGERLPCCAAPVGISNPMQTTHEIQVKGTLPKRRGTPFYRRDWA